MSAKDACLLRVLLVQSSGMLTIFRRHLKTCKFAAKGRKHRHCNCPRAVEVSGHDALVRQSLDLHSCEAAHKLVSNWEIQEKKPVMIDQAADRLLIRAALKRE